MNRILGILGTICMIAACKEVGPPGFTPYNPGHVLPDDSVIARGTTDTTIPQKKMVLLEEMTGVRCPNCPRGQALAERLADTVYPGQIAVVAVHGNNFLTKPYGHDENYDNADNDAVDSYVGPVGVKPSAAMDRFFDPSVSSRLSGTGSWQANVISRLAVPNDVKIYFLRSYAAASRHLAVKVFVKYNRTDTSANRLHLFLTESGLKSIQDNALSKNSSGRDTGYSHDNVLRKILSLNGVNGDVIAGQKKAGYLFSHVYTFDLPANFNPDNCHLVAFVSGTPTDNLAVVQAQTIPLK